MVKQFSGGFANGFFVIEKDTVIMVDTGCEEGESIFLQQCRENDINPLDIKLLVLTHGHSDHYYNAGAIRQVTGAKILIHEKDAHFPENGEMPDVDIQGRTKLGIRILEEQNKAGHGPVTEAPVVPVDIKWSGKHYDLRPWGIQGDIYLTPGHTLGSSSVLLEDGSAIVGDLFAEWQPVTGGGPSFLQSTHCQYTDVQDGLQFLLDKRAEVFYSGHGGPYTREFVKQKLDEERNGVEVGEEFLSQWK